MKTLALLLVAWVAAAGTVIPVPPVEQPKDGCGAATVVMVMRYWEGQKAPRLEDVHKALYRRELKSIRLLDMKTYLEEHGFRAFTLRGTQQDLQTHLDKKRPLIVGLKKRPSAGYHFTVVVGINESDVWLSDPEREKPRRMKRSKFEKRWSWADNWLLLATP